MTMTTIILLILYILEVMKYNLAYYVSFSKKIKRKDFFIFGAIPWVLLSISGIKLAFHELHIAMYMSVIVVMLFLMEGDLKTKVLQLFILFFWLSCTDEMFDGFIGQSSLSGTDFYVNEYGRYLFASLSTFSVVILATILKSVLKPKYRQSLLHILGEVALYLVIVMVIGMILTITGLDYAKGYIDLPEFNTYVNNVSAVSYIGVGVLGALFLYIYDTNKRIKDAIHKEVMLNNMQQQYYSTLLEKENDTRKYRHDMDNHLICLHSFVDEGDMDSLRAYLMKMSEQLENIKNKSFSIGNNVLEAITNYYLSMLPDNTKITVVGRVDGIIHIDDVDLCTVYANLLKNAIEEILREKEKTNSFIEITFRQGREFFQIEIKNSLSKTYNEKDQMHLRTKKGDEKNHGIGLKNVSRVVESLAGYFEIKIEEDSFYVNVILKN